MTPGSVHPLSSEEAEAFTAARVLALHRMPYLASLLFAVIPVRTPGLGTFAVDRHWRLYLDPVILLRWESPTTAAVLLHEAGHLLREHHARAITLGVDSPRLWNLAADAEINDDLLEAGWKFPHNPVTPHDLGEAPGQLAEVYYQGLLAEAAESGVVSCGSGSGGEPVDGELADDSTPGRSEIDQQLVRRKVAADTLDASRALRPASPVPGGMLRWAQRALEPPRVD